MVLLTLAALAAPGSKSCTYRGLPATLAWDGTHVVFLDGEAELLKVPVALPEGVTTARCLPEGLKLLTDVSRDGKLTLETHKVDFSKLLDTLDAERFTRNQRREEEALTCNRTTVWEGYGEGWRVRSLTSDVVPTGNERVLLLSLLPDTRYRFSACADASATGMSMELIDLEGRVVKRSSGDSRRQEIIVENVETVTRYLLVQHTGPSEAGVSVAVGYR
ncbi:MAG: hypothetical protein H6736_23170 [Alphaproteobacteria bacterium]|nr:hypothetical protein [Alphaproteobacteria bacterium]MCB9694723.1 hypothetical protein [Alphaproteobacteria bacterium]